MEWVEVTGRSVEEAKEAALDQLGVDVDEAEFEILEEPKAGLFGRLRSEARVRARVAPSSPRPKLERRDRRKGRRTRDGSGSPGGGSGGSSGLGSSGGSGGGSGGSGGSGAAGGGSDGAEATGAAVGTAAGRRRGAAGGNRNRHQEDDVAEADDRAGGDEAGDEDEVEVAESFLTGLLETYGTPFTVERRDLDDDLVELSVKGEDLGLLIGPRGQTLAAVQELTRTVVLRRSRGRASRIVLDVAGYRQARRAALERFATEVSEQVKSSGVSRVLEPMPPADRKVVHDTVNSIDGVSTTSEGEEPRRRVVISPQPAGG